MLDKLFKFVGKSSNFILIIPNEQHSNGWSTGTVLTRERLLFRIHLMITINDVNID